MPWREDISPYSIFVSEVMLQQTQVSRVLEKFPQFISSFPDFSSLANASQRKLLSVWQGMGYNRRALYLKKAAIIIMDTYSGILPQDPTVLDTLPGIGHATASSICAFAFSLPVIFVETNIRRVMIYFFCKDKKKVDDRDILPFVEKTLDKKNPREWYWALMDYGAYLGRLKENPNKKSRQYVKQSIFVGSVRQIRGKLLKLLLKKSYTLKELIDIFSEDKRVEGIIKQLEKEEFVKKSRGKYTIL